MRAARESPLLAPSSPSGQAWQGRGIRVLCLSERRGIPSVLVRMRFFCSGSGAALVRMGDAVPVGRESSR